MYQVCRSCGSAFLPEDPLDFEDYYLEYDPSAVRGLPDVVAGRYRDILQTVEGRTAGRRLLEVGCGNGHFLEVARDRGWEVCGTELSRPHVERARAKGLEVVPTDIVKGEVFAERRFDLVVVIEVVEHVPDPAALLRAAALRLAPGGWLYLTTPNYGSLTRRVVGAEWSQLDREHVVLATPAGLRAALRAAGFGFVRVRSKNLFLGEFRKRFGRRRPSHAVRNVEVAQLRDRIEESASLRALKRIVNLILGLTGLGEVLEVWARREGSS
jgi:SAM-dependent methyltransferase